jgi:hypothetical protein
MRPVRRFSEDYQMSKEATKLALAALECLKRDFDADQFEWGITDEAITALREARDHIASGGKMIKQPAQQEPVYVYTCKGCQALFWENDLSCDCTVNGLFDFNRHILSDYTSPPQRKPLTADELKEPKNGEQWHVVWWNESCRMMLPSDAKLDSFVAYKNGTLKFTIKKAAYGIKENT